MKRKNFLRNVLALLSFKPIGFLGYIRLKKIEENFRYITLLQQSRIRLYSKESRNAVEGFSAEIKEYGNTILLDGEYFISKNVFTKKQAKTVQEIIDQTKKIMTF